MRGYIFWYTVFQAHILLQFLCILVFLLSFFSLHYFALCIIIIISNTNVQLKIVSLWIEFMFLKLSIYNERDFEYFSVHMKLAKKLTKLSNLSFERLKTALKWENWFSPKSPNIYKQPMSLFLTRFFEGVEFWPVELREAFEAKLDFTSIASASTV